MKFSKKKKRLQFIVWVILFFSLFGLERNFLGWEFGFEMLNEDVCRLYSVSM